MGDFIVNTAREQKEMCQAIGVETPSDLFNGLPEDVRLTAPLNIPEGKSEAEVLSLIEDMAEQNKVFRTCGIIWLVSLMLTLVFLVFGLATAINAKKISWVLTTAESLLRV